MAATDTLYLVLLFNLTAAVLAYNAVRGLMWLPRFRLLRAFGALAVLLGFFTLGFWALLFLMQTAPAWLEAPGANPLVALSTVPAILNLMAVGLCRCVPRRRPNR